MPARPWHDERSLSAMICCYYVRDSWPRLWQELHDADRQDSLQRANKTRSSEGLRSHRWLAAKSNNAWSNLGY